MLLQDHKSIIPLAYAKGILNAHTKYFIAKTKPSQAPLTPLTPFLTVH